MSKFFLNTNPAYGDDGPFEALSVYDLADEMEDCFKTWAQERWNQADELERGDQSEAAFIEAEIDAQYNEFIEGLEEVKIDSEGKVIR